MSLLTAAAARLSRQDMLQGMTALLAAMCLVLALQWPSGSQLVNDSWFLLAPVRSVLLALGGLAWGASLGSRRGRRALGEAYVPSPTSPPLGEPAWHREVAATLVAVIALVVITAPFEVLAYAATYPGTGLGWSLLAPLLAATGFFGLGLALGRLSRLARVVPMLPLLVPAVMAAAVWLDLSLGVRVLNPWFAATQSSPWFAALMAALSVGALLAAAPLRRHQA